MNTAKDDHTANPKSQNTKALQMKSPPGNSMPSILSVLMTSTAEITVRTPASNLPSKSVHHRTTTRKASVKATMPTAPTW
jgi:hypothetical protein